MMNTAFTSIRLFTLKNKNGVEVHLTNFGATLVALKTPDRHGVLADVVLGYATVDEYINALEWNYFGCIVGRYGNRIAKGRFQLEGESYTLATNNGVNHLHGGLRGFDKRVWGYEEIANGVRFSLRSLAGDEGYPGTLDVEVAYTLTDANELVISYRGVTDAATVVNLTNHSYFNLKGEGNGSILDHELSIRASHITAVNENLIPTGELKSIKGTPFDFTTAKTIGRDIGMDDEQLKFGNGYDHNFVLDRPGAGLSPCAMVHEPVSGRVMEVLTTEPGVQFYCGNFLTGHMSGKAGKPYIFRGGFCLETQHYPDSPNQPTFPSTVLKSGETYQSQTVYRFSVK